MSNKQDSDKEPKETTTAETKDCCQGGYGYMKRRLGLLSFEVDQIKDKVSKTNPKDT